MSISPSSFSLNFGILLLRLSTGGLLLLHGIAKLIHGHDFIEGLLAEKGLPQFLWLGVPLTEVIAPVLLILGVFTRLSGLSIALLIVFTIVLAHPTQLFTITQTGGLALELNLLYLFAGLALFFIGGGRYSLYQPQNNWLK